MYNTENGYNKSQKNIYSMHSHLPPQDTVEYPPNIYFPTLTKVIVFPTLSHLAWNIRECQPSSDALQQHVSLLKENHCFSCVRKLSGSSFNTVEAKISPEIYNYTELFRDYNKKYLFQLCKQWHTGCPSKSGVLLSNSNFEKNIKQQNYCLCSFKSLFIQLSLDTLSIEFNLWYVITW